MENHKPEMNAEESTTRWHIGPAIQWTRTTIDPERNDSACQSATARALIEPSTPIRAMYPRPAFLFGAGASATAAESYQSIFVENKIGNISIPPAEEENHEESPRPNTTRSKVSLFNFIAPFARYFIAINTGNLLLKLGQLVPRVLPSTTHQKKVYFIAAGSILLLDFICLALRSFPWFPSSAPFLNPLKNHGRQVLRRTGRRGWYVWYLTQPTTVLISLTLCLIALGLLSLLPQSIPHEAASTHPALLLTFKWVRNLFFMLGLLHLCWSTMNFMSEKSWTRQAIVGIFSFVFGAIISLAIGITMARPEDMPPFLGP
jgi:hypothetical protein